MMEEEKVSEILYSAIKLRGRVASVKFNISLSKRKGQYVCSNLRKKDIWASSVFTLLSA
jgi:hypothetical protein